MNPDRYLPYGIRDYRGIGIAKATSSGDFPGRLLFNLILSLSERAASIYRIFRLRYTLPEVS